MTLDKATAAIRAHGHRCYRTAEGLLAYCESVVRAPSDDRVTEEPHTFPVDAEGAVSRAAVLAWLGY